MRVQLENSKTKVQSVMQSHTSLSLIRNYRAFAWHTHVRIHTQDLIFFSALFFSLHYLSFHFSVVRTAQTVEEAAEISAGSDSHAGIKHEGTRRMKASGRGRVEAPRYFIFIFQLRTSLSRSVAVFRPFMF